MQLRQRHRQLQGDDEEVQTVMEFLWGTWDVDELTELIDELLHPRDKRRCGRVAQRICDIHCGGEGYSDDDIVRELQKLV